MSAIVGTAIGAGGGLCLWERCNKNPLPQLVSPQQPLWGTQMRTGCVRQAGTNRICVCPAALGKSSLLVSCAGLCGFPMHMKPKPEQWHREKENKFIYIHIGLLGLNNFYTTGRRCNERYWETGPLNHQHTPPKFHILSTHCCDRRNKVSNKPPKHPLVPSYNSLL